MSNALVDIIIPCHNMARYLPQAIESALAQSYRPIRVLVVDDGSSEDIRSVVSAFGDRVGYLRQEHLGQGAARNNGIRHSEGEYLCFLDADDLILPGKTASQVEYLERHPEADLVHGQCLMFSGEDAAFPYAERRPFVPWRDYLEPAGIFCPLAMHSLTARRRLTERHGGFPEEMTKGCEDWAYWFRCLSQGAVFAHLPGVVALYRQHGGSSSGSYKRIAAREAAMMGIMLANFRAGNSNSRSQRGALSCGVRFVALRLLACGMNGDYHALLRDAAAAGVLDDAANAARLMRREPSPVSHLRLAGELCALELPELACYVLLHGDDLRIMRRLAAAHGLRALFDDVLLRLEASVAGELPASGTALPPESGAGRVGDLHDLERRLAGGLSHAGYLLQQLALLRAEQGALPEAVTTLERAIALNPLYRPFYEELVETLQRFGRQTEAEAVVGRLQAIDGGSGFVRYWRAKRSLKGGRLAAGVRELGSAWSAAGSVAALGYLLKELDPLAVPRLSGGMKRLRMRLP